MHELIEAMHIESTEEKTRLNKDDQASVAASFEHTMKLWEGIWASASGILVL